MHSNIPGYHIYNMILTQFSFFLAQKNKNLCLFCFFCFFVFFSGVTSGKFFFLQILCVFIFLSQHKVFHTFIFSMFQAKVFQLLAKVQIRNYHLHLALGNNLKHCSSTKKNFSSPTYST